MNEFAITSIKPALAFDSRGNPTVASEVRLAGGGRAIATAPAGASTGSHEATELRDGGSRFAGRGVSQAIDGIRAELEPAVRGLDAREQAIIDSTLRAQDGTATLGRLGANAVLSISIAAALAAAQQSGHDAYRYFAAGTEPLMPMPMVNIFSGGAHATDSLDIQDILAVPLGARSFSEAIEWVWELRHALTLELRQRGFNPQLVADEGGFGVALASNREGLALVTAAIEKLGLNPGTDLAIALDVAATELYDGTQYTLQSENRVLRSDQMVAELASWAADYPVVSIEDALAEDDWEGWKHATDVLGHLQLVGDDLFVTSTSRLARGVAAGIANAVLVKPNQCGTLTEAKNVTDAAHEAGYATVLSARSGETEESWLADLAVGWRTGQIKVGSLTRSERTVKWNRLLRIESKLGSDLKFAGAAALALSPAPAVI